MNYEAKVKTLREKTTLLPDTFESFGITIESIGFSGIDDDMFDIILEVSGKLKRLENIDIKANLYDKEGNIIATESVWLNSEKDRGYDSFTMLIDEPDIVERTEKIRLFATLS